MTVPVARKHHYVPRFLLRKWAVNGKLHGYHWDRYKQEVRVSRRGVASFCKKLDLLSLQAAGLRPDALEQDFFGYVDDRAAKVLVVLLDSGPESLDSELRSDFARFLLSLDARRPSNVLKLRVDAVAAIESELNNDPEILDAFKTEGISERPSTFLDEATGVRIEDRALLLIQKLVDNQTVGKRLINGHWRTYQLGPDDGTLVFSDRPLIRINGYDHPKGVWALPISPRCVFVAANSYQVIDGFDRRTPRQIRKHTNRSSIEQADRYVFMKNETNLPLVRRHLPRVSGSK